MELFDYFVSATNNFSQIFIHQEAEQTKKELSKESEILETTKQKFNFSQAVSGVISQDLDIGNQ